MKGAENNVPKVLGQPQSVKTSFYQTFSASKEDYGFTSMLTGFNGVLVSALALTARSLVKYF